MSDDPVDKAEDAVKDAMDPPREDPKSPEPGPSGEERTDIGTPAEHESEVVAAPEPSGLGDPDPPPSREGVKRVLIFMNEVAGGRKLGHRRARAGRRRRRLLRGRGAPEPVRRRPASSTPTRSATRRRAAWT